MATIQATRAARSPLPSTSTGQPNDERSLLFCLEQLLEREDALLVSRDAAALAAVADERERITERLGHAARERRAAVGRDPADDAELIASYRRLRLRHEVQARIVRQHLDHNARAIGVIAQATGQSNLYQANGRVPLQFLSV